MWPKQLDFQEFCLVFWHFAPLVKSELHSEIASIQGNVWKKKTKQF